MLKNRIDFILNNKLKKLKLLTLVMALFFVLLASLGIKGGTKLETIKSEGIDLAFVLDVSKSMQVLDIKDSDKVFSRLDGAKVAISNFVRTHPENRFSLVVFAQDATSICPLTYDSEIFLTFLAGVDQNNVNKQGTSLKTAIYSASRRFEKDNNRSKLLVLISDGGDPEDQEDFSDLKTSIQDSGVNLILMGIGTEQGGPVPEGRDMFGNIVYKQQNGQSVTSKLNEDSLKSLAKVTGGEYFRIQDKNDIDNVDSAIQGMTKTTIERSAGTQKNLSREFAFGGFVFFLIFLILFFEERYGYIGYFRKKI